MGLRRSAFAVAVLVAGVAGCTSVRPAGPAVLTPAALDLAVRAEPYRAEQSLLRRTEHALTRACMAARGYPYPAAGTDTVLDDPWRPDLDGRRRHGYGFARPGPAAAGRIPPRAGYERALSGDPDRRATLRLSSGPRFTFATTGCLAESRAGLYGGVIEAARADYVPQEAYNALLPYITGDPDLREATRTWSSCMRGRGHPYESMDAARAAASSASRADRPAGKADESAGKADESAGKAPAFEIRVAVADGECALAVGLPGLVDRLGRRHAGKLTAGQRRDLNAAADIRAAALRRARSR